MNYIKFIFIILWLTSTLPTSAINADTVYVGDNVVYKVEGISEGSKLIWKASGANVIAQDNSSITVSYTEVGEYSLMVCEQNAAQCIGEFFSIDIVATKRPETIPEEPAKTEDLEISFPNIFTPNSDGINDIYHITYNIRPENFSIRIYNRQGKEVYKSTSPDFGWTGADFPPDTYFYTCQYSHKGLIFSKKGTINLARQK